MRLLRAIVDRDCSDGSTWRDSSICPLFFRWISARSSATNLAPNQSRPSYSFNCGHAQAPSSGPSAGGRGQLSRARRYRAQRSGRARAGSPGQSATISRGQLACQAERDVAKQFVWHAPVLVRARPNPVGLNESGNMRARSSREIAPTGRSWRPVKS